MIFIIFNKTFLLVYEQDFLMLYMEKEVLSFLLLPFTLLVALPGVIGAASLVLYIPTPACIILTR